MTAGDEDQAWSGRALRACLDHLGVSGVTDARQVSAESSWTDGPTAFCIVYVAPWSDERIGLRRDAADAVAAVELMSWRPVAGVPRPEWDHHNMMTSGYDMDDDAVGRGALPDPVGFGRNVCRRLRHR